MAAALQQAGRGRPLLAPVKFLVGAERYSAVAFPGNATVDVGAARRAETDLVAPLGDDVGLPLTRYYSSFIGKGSDEPLGAPWTLNLPFLDEQPRPIRRTRTGAEYTAMFSLRSALGSPGADFVTRRFVPEAGGELLVPSASSEILGLASAQLPEAPAATRVVLFRDGHEWFFDGEGQLAAWRRGSAVVHYRWQDGRVRSIDGLLAGETRASIRLAYDDAGRLTRAETDAGEWVEYTYDGSNRLAGVRGIRGNVTEYRYGDNGLLAEVLRDGQMTDRFEYSAQGRLLREQSDGRTVEYVLEQGSGRTSLAIDDGAAKARRFEFDDAMRPLHQELADGTVVDWTHDPGGASVASVAPPGGRPFVLARSADGNTVSWTLPEGGEYRAVYTEADRTWSLVDGSGSRVIGARRLAPDGRLEWVSAGPVMAHPRLRPDGGLAGVVVGLSEAESTALREWISVGYDTEGRPSSVEDFSGFGFEMTRDAAGRPLSWRTNGAEVHFERDVNGNVTGIETSWGDRQETRFDAAGRVTTTTLDRKGERTTAEFRDGRLVGLHQFDGGRLEITYGPGDGGAGPARILTPSGLELRYTYDSLGRVTQVDVDGVRRIRYRYDRAGRVSGLSETPLRK